MDLRTIAAPVPDAAAPWQRAWETAYPCETGLSLPYPRGSVAVLLEHAARRFPGRAACTLYRRATSYARLEEQARRLARSLQTLGAGPGRHVAVLLPNMPEHAIALQAVWLTGATVLQLSPLMVAEEVSHWLQATGCTIIITLDLLAPLVIGSLGRGPLEHVLFTTLRHRVPMWRGWLYRLEHYRRNHTLSFREDAHKHTFDHLLDAAPLTDSPPVRPEEDVAVMVPTGGTTASPKAVLLTHRNLIANAFQLRELTGGIDGAESILSVLPFFHSYGLSACLLGAWVKASTVHMLPRYETRAVLNLVARERIDLLPLVPTMITALNAELKKHPIDLSFIRAVTSGASALPAAARAEFESHGIRDLLEGYGLSEASPVTHTNRLGALNRPGTVGPPLVDTEAKVVDQETGRREMPDGEPGELIVRGPQVMKGYYNNPEATAAALRDGWLYTGDVATRDRDGYYRIVDRKKDIIKTSGFLVFPAEVEEVISRFPAVAEAAVFGVPDEERGELIRALVVPRDDHLDVAALERFCGEHLGKHKRPRQFEVVQELPKNFLGKVLRRKLREAAR
ncbi:MAG TPA: AMP-binding protein [Gemmataceae bacterium]|nr:AMP-binding protein [Gemmataceae bacterium]